MKKKILTILAVIAVIAYFVVMNTVGHRYKGTFFITDGGNWTSISGEVTEGDAEEFIVELAGPQRIEVIYDGKLDFRAVLTLTDDAGNSTQYELLIYSSWSNVQNVHETVSELNPLE